MDPSKKARGCNPRMLTVEICNLRNLILSDDEGAYAIFGFPGRRKQTETIFGDPSPQWDEKLQLLINMTEDEKTLEVILFKQKEKLSIYFGIVKIPEKEFVAAGSETVKYFAVEKEFVDAGSYKYFALQQKTVEVGLKLSYNDVAGESLPLDLMMSDILPRLPARDQRELIKDAEYFASILLKLDFHYFPASPPPPPPFTYGSPRLLSVHTARNRVYFVSSSPKNPSGDTLRYQIQAKLERISQVIKGYVILSLRSRIQLCEISSQTLVDLPKIRTWRKNRKMMKLYFGYSPAQDSYKVLCLRMNDNECVVGEQLVLTLGVGYEEGNWRTVFCSIPHFPFGVHNRVFIHCYLSINGALYYLATRKLGEKVEKVLMCFYLASEEFSVIEFTNLEFVSKYFNHTGRGNSITPVNFNGKLAFAHLDKFQGLLELMVLESDHEWSMVSMHISLDVAGWGERFGQVDEYGFKGDLYLLGTLSSGELAFFEIWRPTSVLSYDPKTKKTKRIVFDMIGRRFVNSQGSESPIENYTNRYLYTDQLRIEGISLDHLESVPRIPSFTRPRLLKGSA